MGLSERVRKTERYNQGSRPEIEIYRTIQNNYIYIYIERERERERERENEARKKTE
jgi:hypothetical protein